MHFWNPLEIVYFCSNKEFIFVHFFFEVTRYEFIISFDLTDRYENDTTTLVSLEAIKQSKNAFVVSFLNNGSTTHTHFDPLVLEETETKMHRPNVRSSYRIPFLKLSSILQHQYMHENLIWSIKIWLLTFGITPLVIKSRDWSLWFSFEEIVTNYIKAKNWNNDHQRIYFWEVFRYFIIVLVTE